QEQGEGWTPSRFSLTLSPCHRVTLSFPEVAMARSKPTLARLHDLTPGQFADFFVLLAERTKGATREGKPFYTCRFKDAKRTVSLMVWADSGWFEACEKDWREGHFYKVRGGYVEHERYGPQIEIVNIRATTDADRADGFDPGE